MLQQSLVLLKPDCVQRRLMGQVISRFEAKGLKIVAMKMLQVTPELAKQHYAEHVEKPFYPSLEAFITSAPIVAMAVEGLDVVRVIRDMLGATSGLQAAPGTIRGDFSSSRQMNLVHASDSDESAARELGLYFAKGDFCDHELLITPALRALTTKGRREIASQMRIHLTSTSVRILAPAKVNLFLEVLGKRDDGFHEIETVMCPVSLVDELSIEPLAGSKIEFDVRFAAATNASPSRTVDPAWEIPASEENLVVRALRSTQRIMGGSNGCRVRLLKRIPASAGLGGGSSDAAAAVVGYMALYQCWNRAAAIQVCRDLGSDIPFFLGSPSRLGLALATGRGETCKLLSCQPALEFVILHPPVGCVTGEVYAGYVPPDRTRSSQKIVQACQSGQLQKIGAELFNALQLSATQANPWITRQLEVLEECGFVQASMSGSGSSCFAITQSTHEATEIERKAREIGIPRTYFAKSWFAAPIEEQLSQALP